MRKIRNADLGRKTSEEFQQAAKRKVVLVLDNIRSLNNIGAVFRSADAFLCERICLCGITATPPHREIHKTALGAEDTVKWQHYAETTTAILELQHSGYRVIAIEQVDGCIPLDQLTLSADEKTAYVFGHEIDGVREDVLALLQEAVEIPQFGTKHSINISVCAGIVLWDHFLKTNTR
jgi:tRNA G18 (ribose-2'-O)-methylase SpoU